MNTIRQHVAAIIVSVLAVPAPALTAHAAIFSNSTQFTNAAGAAYLTIQDFKGLSPRLRLK